MKRTKIIATLGPASNSPAMLEKLILAGVDVFRLNFSHGDQDTHKRTVGAIRRVAKKIGAHTAIMQDLQGPKIRVGALDTGKCTLEPGAETTITTRDIIGINSLLPTTYKALPKDVKPGDRILIDDGNMELSVKQVKGTEVSCEVVKGGVLKEHKGMNLPGVNISAPSMTAKDKSDLALGLSLGVDFVAMSFVRHGADMQKLRRIVDAAGADPQLIAKIERPEGVRNLDAILEHADGVLVARGDLGVEVPPEQVPELQKTMIERANAKGKHAITATQMLESMINNPRPTRAEASDVANAVLDGTGAVMLSAETSVGSYPVEAVAMMSRICVEAEKRLLRNEFDAPLEHALFEDGLNAAVARAAVPAANALHASAILAFTQSGSTALLLSKYRPSCPIIGGTLHEKIARRMSLTWGVVPVLFGKVSNTENLVSDVDAGLLKTGLVKHGDLVVITFGVPVGKAGTTNIIKIHRMGFRD